MNYGELKTAVMAYAHRTDAAALIPTWLALAEQRIYFGESGVAPLRVSAMVKQTSLATVARPADFLEAFMVHENGDATRVLELRPLSGLSLSRSGYSWDGQNIVLSEGQALPVNLYYYARFDPLVDNADTNWLLTNAPNVYLSSFLVELARWSRDDALGTREAGAYASAVNSLNSQDKAASISGSSLRIRYRGH